MIFARFDLKTIMSDGRGDEELISIIHTPDPIERARQSLATEEALRSSSSSANKTNKTNKTNLSQL
jgi:hypothetical protein